MTRVVWNLVMPLKIIPDTDKPSVAIEIPLEKSLPDYDLVDDARGVLMDLLAHPPFQAHSPENANLDFTHSAPMPLELTQLTGAICPGDDESYRPGLWIVLQDPHAKPGTPLPPMAQERITAIVHEFVKRLQLV